MFGFGKSKARKEKLEKEQSIIENYRNCIQNGYVPLVGINNSQPVFLNIQNVPLYEIKTSRRYASMGRGGARIGTSESVANWQQTDTGHLTVTGEVITYLGNKTTINFQRSKIISIDCLYGELKNKITGVKVHVSNRQKPVIFGIQPPEYCKEVILFGLTSTSNWKLITKDAKPYLIDTNKFPSGN
jgi:hypothetical protein